MLLYIWIIFIIMMVLILAPLFHSDLFDVDSRYKYFKYVSAILLLWCIISFSRYIVTDPYLIYYFSMSIFPIALLLTMTMFFAVLRYINKDIKLVYKIILWFFFIIEGVLSFTNSSHQLMLQVVADNTVTFGIFKTVKAGSFFYLHITLAYSLMVIFICLLGNNLLKKGTKNSDYFPFLFVSIGVIFGLAANFIHLFVYTFTVDPTFITFVIVISIIYYVFYMRDIKLILGLNRNYFILNNLREKYILVDDNNIVVYASSMFIELFDIRIEEQLSFNELKKRIEKEAVIYESSVNLNDFQFNENKVHFNMQSREIDLPFYKKAGTFYLFYDDTASQKYINSIQYIKTHDLMTELYNRNYLEEIRVILDKNDKHYHLIMFDLDGLKLFNDYLGHQAGDQLLIRFAKKLSNLSDHKNVIPIRLGGDEFLLIIINRDQNYAEEIIKTLDSQNIDKPILETLHYSYGIATNKNTNKTMDRILSEADHDMYKRKLRKDNYKEKLQAILSNKKI